MACDRAFVQLRAARRSRQRFAEGVSEGWRRGRDSNPWKPFDFNGFQDRRLKPLGHLSATPHSGQSRTIILRQITVSAIAAGTWTGDDGTAMRPARQSPCSCAMLHRRTPLEILLHSGISIREFIPDAFLRTSRRIGSPRSERIHSQSRFEKNRSQLALANRAAERSRSPGPLHCPVDLGKILL